jgi:hypothetical protein
LGVGARVAARQAGRSRWGRATANAVSLTAKSFGRVLHQLWHEVMGLVFLAMAGVGGIAMSREWAKYTAAKTGPGRLVIAACFCLTFGYFGVSSFWKVRKKS